MSDWTDDDTESEDDVIVQTDDESDDDGIEAPPPSPVKEDDEENQEPVKRSRGRPRLPRPPVSAATGRPKKVLTEKQLAALAKGRETRNANRSARANVKEEAAAIKKKEREEKIVTKAVRLRKRQVLEEAALELSSEEEADDFEIKAVKRIVAKRKAVKKAATKPKRVVSEPTSQAIDPPPQQNEFIFY